jgi:uncharacterized pyridoxamine 5'-phosphate oxidase family protein
MDNKKKIFEFLKQLKIGVISTVDQHGKPESAVVGFGVMDNLELFFGTNISTRKYKNVKENPNISFVIGWDEGITVQYEGVASEFADDQVEQYKEAYFQKNPTAKKFANNPGQTYFKVSPTWIRYTDLSNPEGIFEIKL